MKSDELKIYNQVQNYEPPTPIYKELEDEIEETEAIFDNKIPKFNTDRIFEESFSEYIEPENFYNEIGINQNTEEENNYKEDNQGKSKKFYSKNKLSKEKEDKNLDITQNSEEITVDDDDIKELFDFEDVEHEEDENLFDLNEKMRKYFSESKIAKVLKEKEEEEKKKHSNTIIFEDLENDEVEEKEAVLEETTVHITEDPEEENLDFFEVETVEKMNKKAEIDTEELINRFDDTIEKIESSEDDEADLQDIINESKEQFLEDSQSNVYENIETKEQEIESEVIQEPELFENNEVTMEIPVVEENNSEAQVVENIEFSNNTLEVPLLENMETPSMNEVIGGPREQIFEDFENENIEEAKEVQGLQVIKSAEKKVELPTMTEEIQEPELFENNEVTMEIPVVEENNSEAPMFETMEFPNSNLEPPIFENEEFSNMNSEIPVFEKNIEENPNEVPSYIAEVLNPELGDISKKIIEKVDIIDEQIKNDIIGEEQREDEIKLEQNYTINTIIPDKPVNYELEEVNIGLVMCKYCGTMNLKTEEQCKFCGRRI